MSEQVIIIGLVLSVLFWEWTNLTPGGLIVTGYLVLALKTPSRIAYTLALSVATFLVIKFLSRYLIIYGKRRFVAMILMAFLLNSAAGLALPIFAKTMSIGVLVPGIIANEYDKQGIIPSLIAQVFVGGVLVVILFLLKYPVFG